MISRKKMHSIFGRTYVRESSLHFLYCTMKQVKSINKNRMADDTMDDRPDVLVATTKTGIDKGTI